MLKIEVGITSFYEFQNLSGRFGKVLLEGGISTFVPNEKIFFG